MKSLRTAATCSYTKSTRARLKTKHRTRQRAGVIGVSPLIGRRVGVGVELVEEVCDAIDLVRLVDRCCGIAQPR